VLEIKIGATVKLNSGGPIMTIHYILGQSPIMPSEAAYKKLGYSDGDLVCTWFEDKTRKEDCFRKEEVCEPFGFA
jgi:uncharacterized protein YodC (DUF2158 family)